MLIFRPLGAIGRHICPSLRGLWLISERGTDARDNGYRFYSYLVSEQPEVNGLAMSLLRQSPTAR